MKVYPKHVIVVGGGFAGMNFIKALAVGVKANLLYLIPLVNRH